MNFSVLAPNLFPLLLLMIFLHLPLWTAQVMLWEPFYMDKVVSFQSAFIVRKSPTEAGGDDGVIAAVPSNRYAL